MVPIKPHATVCEVVDSATTSTLHTLGAGVNMPGVSEVVSSAVTAALHTPHGVATNAQGKHDCNGEFQITQSRGSDNKTAASSSTSSDTNNSKESVKQLSRLDAYNAFVAKSRELYSNGRPTDLNSSERINIVWGLLSTHLKPMDSIQEHKTALNRSITAFISKAEQKYASCKRNIKRFEIINQDWLSKPFIDWLPDEIQVSATPSPEPFTREQSMALIIDVELSDNTFDCLSEDLNERGFRTFPPFELIKECRKECYPTAQIQVTEVEASVSLQALLDHTFQRIVKTCEEDFNQYCEQQGTSQLDCKFEASWSIDGSLKSLHKRNDANKNDQSYTFVTTFVPLKITHGDQTIWMNPCPQSYRYCRPLHIQYKKESPELINSEKTNFEDQIKKLKPSFVYTSVKKLITAASNLTLCVVDGEVFNTITNEHSGLTCPICKLPASELNSIEQAKSNQDDTSSLKYGLSPMHCWVRVLEFLLHLSYKNDPAVKTWRVPRNSPQGKIVEERKRRIQSEIKEELELLVDKETPDGGFINDVNTAIIAMSEREDNRRMFAKILGIEQWLVDGLYHIVLAVNCGLPVDTEKFGKYCERLAEKYVATYAWFPMSPTVHKLLVHGKDMIEDSILPVGLVLEQTSESRDLNWSVLLQQWGLDLLEWFHWALEFSDPVISSIRLERRKKFIHSIPFPKQVKDMLKDGETNMHVDDDEDNDEWDPETAYEVRLLDEDLDIIILTREFSIFE